MVLWSVFIKQLLEMAIGNIEKKTFNSIRKILKNVLLNTSIIKPVIVITGRSNVGKSVLAKNLVSKTPLELPGQSRIIENLLLPITNGNKKISVIPGQKSKARANAILSEIQNNTKLNGIIYVVDWGYTSMRDSETEKLRIAEGTNTIEELRVLNKKDELNDFAEMVEVIKNSNLRNKRPKWLVVAVNKIDLYYDKIDNAQSYYHPDGNSEFSERLRIALKEIGTLNLTIIVLPISSYPNNLKFNNTEVKNYLPDWGLISRLKYNFLSEMSDLIKDV